MSYCKTNQAEIYYEVYGQGTPLFFLNGVLGNTRMWLESGVVERLTKDFQCILLNFRGQDLTRFEGDFSFEDLVTDLNTIIQELGFTQVDLVGDAFGASLVLAFASDCPEKVRKIILSSGASSKDLNLSFKMRSWAEVLDKTDVETLYNVVFPELYSNQFVEKEWGRLSEFKELLIEHKDKKVLLQFFKALMSRDYHRDLSKVKHPVLIMQGTDDAIIQPFHGKNFKNILQNCTYQEVNSGHVVFMEKPEWYAKNILDFIAGEN